MWCIISDVIFKMMSFCAIQQFLSNIFCLVCTSQHPIKIYTSCRMFFAFLVIILLVIHRSQ